jgi:hypothetical protein
MAMPPGAVPRVPPRADRRVLDHAIVGRGRDLYRDAIRAVLGEGPRAARVAPVGGRLVTGSVGRFVSQAGRLLDRALADAGTDAVDTPALERAARPR